MLNKELKLKWIEALENGKYKQGRGCLKDNKGNFCCIGVFCDLLDSSKWTETIDENMYFYNDKSTYGAMRDILNINIIMKLISLNDLEQWSFEKIAGWIEENVEAWDE
jgi:hypothetical protein